KKKFFRRCAKVTFYLRFTILIALNTVLKSAFLLFILTVTTSSLFSGKLYGQELHLKLEGKDSLETKAIDSIKYKKSHKDFESLNKELTAFKNKLDQIGYIEHNLVNTERIDSLLTATFNLNKRSEEHTSELQSRE